MIEYRKCILDNGLTLLTHEAWDTPLASVCVLYGVGSRNEDPGRTGFAHLFEHLMFGGTRAVPDFDGVVSAMGGDSNAFTNCDYTCYYMTVPAASLGTALALEADRMSGLEINERTLAVQQRVVTEEYHQRYMNQPYGDVWLLLRPLCYGAGHPYSWATIGADIRHVSEATLDDVRAFHTRYYRPDNAILAVAAPMKHEEMLREVESLKWKDESGKMKVESGKTSESGSLSFHSPLSTFHFPPSTHPAGVLRVGRPVPATKVFLAYNICPYGDPMFRAYDLITDMLANGKSSRMHRRLVVESGMMTEADAYLSGEMGPGLLVLGGTLSDGVSAEEGLAALRAEVESEKWKVESTELEKVQNKFENTFVFNQYRASDRAMGLCHYTWLGDTELVNREPEMYRKVTQDDIYAAAENIFKPQNENVLIYEAEGAGE